MLARKVELYALFVERKGINVFMHLLPLQLTDNYNASN